MQSGAQDPYEAVASGASGFLVVRLDAPRGLEVYEEPDVRMVDAHAEGVGRDHDSLLAELKGVLRLGAAKIALARVVERHLELRFQGAGHTLGFGARGAVDDGPAAVGLVGQEARAPTRPIPACRRACRG